MTSEASWRVLRDCRVIRPWRCLFSHGYSRRVSGTPATFLLIVAVLAVFSGTRADIASAHWQRWSAQPAKGLAERVQLAPPVSGDFATMEAARSALGQVPVYAAIRDVYPAEFEALLTIFTDGYAGRQTEQEVNEGVRAIVEGVFVRSIMVAPSEDVIEYLNVTFSIIQELNKIDAEACVGYLNPKTGARPRVDLAERFPLLAERQFAVAAKIIRAAPLSKRHRPRLDEVAADMRAAGDRLRRTHGQKTMERFASGKTISPADFPTYCQMNVDFLRSILALPMERAARVMRYTNGASR